MQDQQDSHGQPRIEAFCARMVAERQIDELIGICKGILADGAATVEEIKFLHRWLECNDAACKKWPGKIIYSIVQDSFRDGRMSAEDEERLVHVLMDFTGGVVVEDDVASRSMALPLDPDPPEIEFAGCLFCFTGKFQFGTRKDCENEVMERGGQTCASPINATDYLVIGQVGSRDWVHSTYGRKIERAVEIRERGHGIAIVSEEHWVQHLGRASGSTANMQRRARSEPFCFEGRAIAITGTLETFSRPQLKQMLEHSARR